MSAQSLVVIETPTPTELNTLMAKSKPILVHVTNIPTPYRIAFCNTMKDVLETLGIGFHVLYCSKRESNRHWNICFNNMHYPYDVLPGVSPQMGSWQAHFNPSVVLHLRRLRPEFLLVAGGWNIPTAMLAASKSLSGPAFRVFWSEGHADAVLNPSGPIAWMRRRFLCAYNAFAVPNESSASFLEQELRFRPVILPLPNTVDDEFYRSAQSLDKNKIRQNLGLPIDATVYVSVTRLDESKGVRELTAAISQLRDNQSHCVLVLVGEGPLRTELETAIRTERVDVRLAGQQDALGVRNYLTAADAFILTTKLDPNPLAVIEAAFAGLPLLVSHKAGNVKELVHEGVSGMVIPAVSIRSIADVLGRFDRLTETERRQLGAGATQLADAGFHQQSVVRNFVDALLALPREHWR
jgi:glycosyltransferase involved in cell wall biosynthesis